MSPEEKKPSQYLSLQPSETAVFHCASRIFAAYVCSGKVTDENRNSYYKTSIRDAMRMAVIVEKSIQSDDELSAS